MRHERLGGASGLLAVVLLGGQELLLLGAAADPALPSFARLLARERWRWETITLLRLAGALAVVWFTTSLASRLRRAGREHAAHAAVALGAGMLWAATWLVSALFNSLAVTFAAAPGEAAATRFAGVLAIESVYVLTPGITLVLLAATAIVALQDRAFPRAFAYGTLTAALLRLVLALWDWYGPHNLSVGLLDVALLWIGAAGTQLLRPRRLAA
ncbi:MAG TPA: hypothetical protein VIH93_04475 [Thermoanaerobaculia bacterium]